MSSVCCYHYIYYHYQDILNGGNKDWRRLSKESNYFGVSNQAMCADRSPEERDGSGQGN